jgi:hypothetical protein
LLCIIALAYQPDFARDLIDVCVNSFGGEPEYEDTPLLEGSITVSMLRLTLQIRRVVDFHHYAL